MEANREGVTKFAMKNPVLLDEDGAMGRAYGAEKTPHMFVVSPDGTLAYVRAGKPVGTAESAAYGCSVKYAKG